MKKAVDNTKKSLESKPSNGNREALQEYSFDNLYAI